MTPCENYWEALNAFVDGECSPEEEAKLRAHLTECTACREALAELTALRGGFPHWEDEEIPEGFADGVLQRIAGILKLDLGTVKSRISRGRGLLRKFLTGPGNLSDSPASNRIETGKGGRG